MYNGQPPTSIKTPDLMDLIVIMYHSAVIKYHNLWIIFLHLNCSLGKATLKKKFVSCPAGGHGCGQLGGRKIFLFFK